MRAHAQRDICITLATALDPLLSEIKELMALKMVQVDRKSYESEFYLGGDLKVMSQHY